MLRPAQSGKQAKSVYTAHITFLHKGVFGGVLFWSFFCNWDVFSSFRWQVLPETHQIITQNPTFHPDASKHLFRTVII